MFVRECIQLLLVGLKRRLILKHDLDAIQLHWIIYFVVTRHKIHIWMSNGMVSNDWRSQIAAQWSVVLLILLVETSILWILGRRPHLSICSL